MARLGKSNFVKGERMSWLEGYVKEFSDSTSEDIIWAWMNKNHQATIGDEKILFDALNKVWAKYKIGKLITESPIKIGQRVWFVTYYDSKSLRDAWICSGIVLAVTITANGICVKLKDSYGHNKTYRLGKSAFLTKEEAKERLKDFLTQ